MLWIEQIHNFRQVLQLVVQQIHNKSNKWSLSLTLEGLRFFGSLASLRGVNMTPEISGLCIRYHGMSYIIGKVIQNGVEIRSNHLDITCLTQVINCLCLLFNKNRQLNYFAFLSYYGVSQTCPRIGRKAYNMSKDAVYLWEQIHKSNYGRIGVRKKNFHQKP